MVCADAPFSRAASAAASSSSGPWRALPCSAEAAASAALPCSSAEAAASAAVVPWCAPAGAADRPWHAAPEVTDAAGAAQLERIAGTRSIEDACCVEKRAGARGELQKPRGCTAASPQLSGVAARPPEAASDGEAGQRSKRKESKKRGETRGICRGRGIKRIESAPLRFELQRAARRRSRKHRFSYLYYFHQSSEGGQPGQRAIYLECK